MGIYLQPADVSGAKNAAELIAELEGALVLDFPCLATLPPDKLPLLKVVLVAVIRRWADIGTGVTTSEAIGPASRSKSNGGGHVLWEHEKAYLRKLCDLPATSAAGLPRGEFPPVEPIADLFARRPQWARPS